MPICKSCGEDKKHYGHGLCTGCYHAKYQSLHKDELKQYNKSYWAAHEDELKQSNKKYRMINRDALLTSCRRYRYANGGKPASENKQCAAFLGVHIAERVLSKVFKDVKPMPYGNKGYDFICNKGKKIDVKSACTNIRDTQCDRWTFTIRRNKIADYFLCIAFDNRKDLNPLHLWLIPVGETNHQMSITISESTLSKWGEYELDINKVAMCCDSMKQ